jgi:putative transposase
MFFKQLIQCVKSCVTKVIQQVEKRLKQWTKPRTESLIVGTLADVIRGKAELIAENALLRQQVIILQRQVKRPHLTQQVGAYWFSWHAGHGVGKTR